MLLPFSLLCATFSWIYSTSSSFLVVMPARTPAIWAFKGATLQDGTFLVVAGTWPCKHLMGSIPGIQRGFGSRTVPTVGEARLTFTATAQKSRNKPAEQKIHVEPSLWLEEHLWCCPRHWRNWIYYVFQKGLKVSARTVEEMQNKTSIFWSTSKLQHSYQFSRYFTILWWHLCTQPLQNPELASSQIW